MSDCVKSFNANAEIDFGVFDIRPILCVQNVARSIDYYVNSLGFRLGWAWDQKKMKFLAHGEDGTPHFALVVCNKAAGIMLSEQSQGKAGMWLHLDVETAAELNTIHERWKTNGARIMEPPSVRPWGMYEMRVEDLDGHVFRVSSPPGT